MAGAFVFPGGKLDEDDFAPQTLARAGDAPPLNETPGVALSRERTLGLYVAACRETFEEAGALFARRRGTSELVALDEERERFDPWRMRLSKREAGISALLEAEDLELDLGRIHYWAHWITPSLEPKRFDTRFFVAEVPAGQTPYFDEHETTEQRWLTPTAALAAHAARELFLPPPTERTLQELEGVKDFADVEARAAARAGRIGPIMPKATVEDGDFTIVLPWDPGYASLDGDGINAEDPEPEANRPTRIVVKPLV